MVKLSEILRKASKEKPAEDKSILSEAMLNKESKPESGESEKIYMHVIVRLEEILAEIKGNNVIDGQEILSLAGMIVDGLVIESNILQNMANDSKEYRNNHDFIPVHSVNVGVVASNIGFAFDFDKPILLDLCIAALLHDVGMLIIPPDIIYKSDRLSNKEFDLIKMHPSYGLKFLQNIKNLPKLVEEVVIQHHEKINGKGYPKGLKGDEVSKFAQIVGISEIYEAISHPRPYREESIILSKAVKIIMQEESNSFDKDVLRAFMNYITVYPGGSIVRLNTDEMGIVQSINKNFPLRPVVEIIRDARGKQLGEPKKVDLSKSPILYIEEAVDDNLLVSE